MEKAKRDSWGQEDEEQFYEETLRSERMIIGAIILDNNLMKHALEHLSYTSFNVIRHQPIFAAMVELDKRKKTISIPNIMEELRSRNKLNAAGGEEYVTSIDQDVPQALRAGQQDYVDRFILITITKAMGAALLSPNHSAEDAFRMFFEKTQQFRQLKGWAQTPLLKEDEGFTN